MLHTYTLINLGVIRRPPKKTPPPIQQQHSPTLRDQKQQTPKLPTHRPKRGNKNTTPRKHKNQDNQPNTKNNPRTMHHRAKQEHAKTLQEIPQTPTIPVRETKEKL